MSRVRIHNFSISLDGFGTGEGLSLEAPFGHAGHRLHEWMLATRFWERLGLLPTDAAGTVGVDNAFAKRHEHGIGAEIMGAGKFGPPVDRTPRSGADVGRQCAVPHPDVRPDPSPAATGGTTFHFLDATPADALDAARGDRRRPGRPYRGWSDDAARVPRRRARRPPARPAGPGRLRSRCAVVGRVGGVGAAVRGGGGVDAQRRHHLTFTR